MWTPSVTASFSRDEDLPDDAEKLALQRGVQFYRNSMLLPNVQRAVDLGMMVPTLPDFSFRQRQYARLSGPYFTNVSGDGQLGVFEGLTSDIDIHGEQPQSNGVRTVVVECARSKCYFFTNDICRFERTVFWKHQLHLPHAAWSLPMTVIFEWPPTF